LTTGPRLAARQQRDRVLPSGETVLDGPPELFLTTGEARGAALRSCTTTGEVAQG